MIIYNHFWVAVTLCLWYDMNINLNKYFMFEKKFNFEVLHNWENVDFEVAAFLSTSKLREMLILKYLKIAKKNWFWSPSKVCSQCLSLTSCDQDSLSQARRSNSYLRKSSHTKTCTSLTSLHPSVTHILTCDLVIRPLFPHLLLSTVTGVRNLKTLW